MKSGDIRLKSADDIKRIRDAGLIISRLFGDLSERALDGITTWEVDSYIDEFILKNKARAAFKTVRDYDFASCISINNEAAHGIPSRKRKIKNGDIVKIDVGTVFRGYFSDSCTTLIAGSAGQSAESLVRVCRDALIRAIASVKPGIRSGDIGHAIESYVAQYGFAVVRKFAGHGTGFSLHEAPSIPHYGSKGEGIIIEEGLVFTIEPVINEGLPDVVMTGNGWTELTADNRLSAQFEHTIAVTKAGPQVLTL